MFAALRGDLKATLRSTDLQIKPWLSKEDMLTHSALTSASLGPKTNACWFLTILLVIGQPRKIDSDSIYAATSRLPPSLSALVVVLVSAISVRPIILGCFLLPTTSPSGLRLDRLPAPDAPVGRSVTTLMAPCRTIWTCILNTVRLLTPLVESRRWLPRRNAANMVFPRLQDTRAARAGRELCAMASFCATSSCIRGRSVEVSEDSSM